MGVSQITHAQEVEVNQTKIKGGCQSERKAAEMISYSKMPLATTCSKKLLIEKNFFFQFITKCFFKTKL